MKWYYIVAMASAVLCFSVFVLQAIYLAMSGMPKDFSKPAGSVSRGFLYSMTTAMMPNNKESAYKHLPTYTAGVLYHIGSLLALLFFVWVVVTIFTDFILPPVIGLVLVVVLAVSSFCGVALLVKRIVKRELRLLSSADDYMSNAITTVTHIATLCFICFGVCAEYLYYLTVSLFFIWLPFGKTKHLLYFFFARLHLGFFYGRRGCWPVKREEKK